MTYDDCPSLDDKGGEETLAGDEAATAGHEGDGDEEHPCGQEEV